MPLRTAWISCAWLILFVLTPVACFAAAEIPELAWEERSDWINVKTAVQPPAKGDGVQDDTAAIQAALNRIQDGVTIYFPPGVYKITKTLEIPDGRFLGVTLLGHGRTSTLAWDGEPNGRMYWSKAGMTVSRYIGLTWDGRNKAAVGCDHACLKIFETELRHQHEAYRDFTEAGIRVGKDLKVATAETVYDNCLFERCASGVALHSFNVLDHTFDGCEFRQCGTGIAGGKGTNWYVRNCHFEANTAADLTCHGEAGCSARRCTSHGSKLFLIYDSSVGPMIIQDCHVDAWTNPEGAISLNGAPVLMFDCGFTHAPNAEPVVRSAHAHQRLVFSNNQAEGVKQLYQAAESAKIVEVPPTSLGGVVKSANQSFLKSQVKVPGKVFDAKRDFGAKGDGSTDDTAAIIKAIEAARAHGKGAIAYLPGGRYAVSETLTLTGSDYYFGGSGYRTALVWKGKAGGTTIDIHDPNGITLENISVGHHDCGVGDNAIDIQQTGTGKPSLMTYDRVWVWGMYQSKPLERGLRLVNLGKQDRVLFREVNGNLHAIDSAQANIYLRLSYEGTILVAGKSPERGGFIGGGVRLGTVTDPAIWLKDNHSFVLGDFYVESSLHLIRMEGSADLPPGRVTLQGAKFELSKPENNGLEVDNYRGELMLGPYQFYVGNPIHHFVQKGSAPFALTLLEGTFYNSKPDFQLSPSSKLGVVAVYAVGLNPDDTATAKDNGLTDAAVTESIPHIQCGLDDLRRLGAIDLEMNHGP